MTPCEFTFHCYELNLNLLHKAQPCIFVAMSIFNNIFFRKGNMGEMHMKCG